MLPVVLLCTACYTPPHPQPVPLSYIHSLPPYIHSLFNSPTSTACSTPLHPQPVPLPYIHSLFTSVHPQPFSLHYIHSLFPSHTSTACFPHIHPQPVHLAYIHSLFTSRTSTACFSPLHPQPVILRPHKWAVEMPEFKEIPTLCCRPHCLYQPAQSACHYWNLSSILLPLQTFLPTECSEDDKRIQGTMADGEV